MLRFYCGQGLEAFASPDTVPAIEELLKNSCADEWYQSLTSNRFAFQWLGLLFAAGAKPRTLHGELNALFLYAKPFWQAHAKAGGDPCPYELINNFSED